MVERVDTTGNWSPGLRGEKEIEFWVEDSDLEIYSSRRKKLGCAIWGSVLEPDKPASKGGSRGEKECLEKLWDWGYEAENYLAGSGKEFIGVLSFHEEQHSKISI